MRTSLTSRAEEKIADFIDIYRRLTRASGERILSRRTMTISAVYPFAPYMTIVDLHSDDEWTASLNGTGHCEHARIDRTGHNVLETCTPEERALRIALAGCMFGHPCGLRATLTETFGNGAQATLETTSLPLLGDGGERKIVTYALLVEDIEDAYGERPVLSAIAIAAYSFVDLGFGTPERTLALCG